MSKSFSVSGQHYLFEVQAFAQVVLSEGGENYHYTLLDRPTIQIIEDVVTGVSHLGILMQTSTTADEVNKVLEESRLEFHELKRSAPRVALPISHPLANAESLSLEDLSEYPYLYFYQGQDTPAALYEEALSDIPRSKTIACSDRASLSELIAALNGYTITSGILVGISDGTSLVTVPLETDIELSLGYITRKGAKLSEIESKFVEKLTKNLDRYARF